jgi:hypothetical protein
VKRKHTLIFILIIKVIDNNGKVIVDVMDWINIVQLDINKGKKKYLKEKDKKIHNLNQNMVNVFVKFEHYNMSCHHQGQETHWFDPKISLPFSVAFALMDLDFDYILTLCLFPLQRFGS